ncbi:MAG: hypothetical protein WAN48_01790 [Actinomycetes bacterium]
MRRVPALCAALEIAAAAGILVVVFGPSGSGEDIGLGMLYFALFVGGIALYLAAVLTIVVLATLKEITWRDARWPLSIAPIALVVICWAVQRLF